MKALREKYAIPKGVVLVPDKLEIVVQRIANDRFHLSYKEYLTYLPDVVLNLAIPITINMLSQIGFPREKITRITSNCVGMEIDGSFQQIAGAIFTELLMQKRFNEGEIDSFLSAIAKMSKALSEWSGLEHEWNSEVEKRYFDNLGRLVEIMQMHPTLPSEIEAIVEKCKQMKHHTNQENEKTKSPS